MEIVGNITDADYIVEDNSPVIRLFVSSNNGKIIIKDRKFEPYCYIIGASEEEVKSEENVKRVEKVKKKLGKEEVDLIKAYTYLPKQVPELKKKYNTFEADILFHRRYLIDKDLSSVDLVKFNVDNDYNLISFEKIDKKAEFNSIAFDIEVMSKGKMPSPEKDPIVSIAVYGNNVANVFTWLDNDKYPKLKDEKECILEFFKFLSENNPDIIVGYNSDNFDLYYLKERAKQLGINPQVEIILKRRNEEELEARVVNFCHIDVFQFIKKIYSIYNLKTETLTLDEVAKEMLGEGKEEFPWDKSENLTVDKNLANTLCSYNLQDARITYLIYKEVEPYILELNKLVGLTLFDVSRLTSGMAVEYMLMRKANALGQLIPNKPDAKESAIRKSRVFQGAFVYQPTPGIYKDIAVVDFRSLYPSIIISRNIDPFTIVKKNNEIEFLSKDEYFGLIPRTVEEVFNLRSKAKDELKKDKNNKALAARVAVLKLIANSFYGYLGYYNSRLYNFDCASSVARIAREYIMKTIEFAEKEGFKVIYADTDSNFLIKPGADIKAEVNKFLEKFNATLPKPMELELQDVYKRAIFVRAVKGKFGARKKYAMVSYSGELVIKGFQSVRRDWSFLAKELQEEVIKKILVDEDIEGAINLVSKTIEDLRQYKIPLEKLVINTMLRKDIKEYESTGRHVRAAEKSGEKFSQGEVISYIIAKGSGGISERAVLYSIALQKNIKYDAEYYIEHQIIPAVTPIFDALGIQKEKLYGKKSSNLLNFT